MSAGSLPTAVDGRPAPARVALLRGIPVPGITLFVFGAVAHILREAAPRQPRDSAQP